MHAKHVKEIMTPLDEYTIVHEDDTLYDAFVALKESRENLKEGQYIHRAVLVVNKKGRIVGKLGHLGFLRALEPKYKLMGDLDLDMISKAGLNKEFISSMMRDFGLWQDELDNVRSKSKSILMKEIDMFYKNCLDEIFIGNVSSTPTDPKHLFFSCDDLSCS